MLRVAGNVPCEGRNGYYEVWAHYLVGERMARLVKYMLPQLPKHIEEWFEPPRVSDPWKLLEMAERGGPEQRWMATRLGAPATASLVRVCNDGSHRDGATSDPGSGRLEAAARLVWVPPGAGRLAVHPKMMAFGDDGVGVAQPTRRHIGSLAPVVTVPLTFGEQQAHTASRQLSEVVETQPSVRPSNIMYAVLHHLTDDSVLEQVFEVPPTATPPPAA